jgi:hypothetical protein
MAPDRIAENRFRQMTRIPSVPLFRLRAGLYGVGEGREGADVAPLLVVAVTVRPVGELTRPCVPVPVDAAGVVVVDPCC